jgi:flagellar biosynthesis/type III secretory pathway protein FliH
MKSFSRIHSPTAQEQPATWTPFELDIDFAVAPVETQIEQILAVFDKNENDANPGSQRLGSILRSRGEGLAIPAWQPEEFELQPALPVTSTWDFVEPSKELEETPPQEIQPEEPTHEKEAEETLKRARLQAEEIILEAHAMVDKILLQAQDEIESEKKEAYRQGWDEGRNELAQALNAVHLAVEEVGQWRDSLTTQGEQILVDMLKEIAQTMFGEGVRLDANALQLNLNRVMEHAQKLGDLNIFINPRDAELLDPSWSEYQLLITGNRVKVIPSEKITLGGCVVKGNMGMIDGRVETQLTSVMNTIDEVREAKE